MQPHLRHAVPRLMKWFVSAFIPAAWLGWLLVVVCSWVLRSRSYAIFRGVM